MKFLRAIFFLLFILTCAPVLSAQETGCTLKLAQMAQAPELRGLRPGMTVAEVKARVPTLQLDLADEFGLSKTSFSPDFATDIDKTAFQGVRTISLEFMDGRVSSLWIGYNQSFKWKTLDEFVPGITAALGLPKAWETKPRGQQILECSDFQVTVMMIAGSPSLRINDKAAKQLWEERRTAKEEATPQN